MVPGSRSVVVMVFGLLLAGCGGSGGASTTPPPPAPPPPAPPPAGAPQGGTWTSMAPLPQARTEVSATAYNGRLYLAGGASPIHGGPREFWIYDAEANSWSQGADVPAGMHHAGFVAHDGKLYLIGGYEGAESHSAGHALLDTLWIYDIAGDAWTAGAPMPTARGALAAAVSGGTIHVVGGTTMHGSVRTHEVYDIASGTWNSATNMHHGRDHVSAAALDGLIYAALGRVREGTTALRNFERYNPATQQWTELAPVPVGRSGAAMVAFQGELYLFGGETFPPEEAATYSRVDRYNPATDSWDTVASMPGGRHGLGAGVIGNAIFTVAGGPSAGWTYSTVNERWTP